MSAHSIIARRNSVGFGSRALLCSVAVCALATLAQPASAQTEDEVAAASNGAATVLPTLAITARRDAENPLEVPVSYGVADSAVISLESPSNASVDVSRSIPNYSVNDVGNPLFVFGAIRGIGTLSFPMNPFDSTISYAQNGMPMSMYAGSQQYLDVSRIEVMRGPQNVLFGRASQGGAVNIVTGQPDGERDIRVRGEFGTNNEYLTDFIAGGTIIDGVLNGRGALRFTGGRGDVKNLSDGSNLPERQIAAGRGSLRWFAGDRTTITASGYYERDDRKTFNFILRDAPNYPAIMLDKPMGFDRNMGTASLEIKHEFDTFDLIGTLGYQNIISHMDSDNTDGLIYGPMFGWPASAFSSTTCSDCTDYRFEEKAWSGEVRASSKEGDPYRWTAGVGAYHSDFNHHGTNKNSLGVTQNGLYDSKLKLSDYSVFGEIDLPVTDQLTITPGLRAGYETVSRDGYYISNGAPGTVARFEESGKVDNAYLAGGLTLSYKLNEQSLAYASIKRGHSGPGFPYFNIDAVYGTPVSSYPASSNWTYEVGTRNSFMDGLVTLEASAFYNDVRKGHVNFFDLTASQFAIASLDYRTYGFEAGATAEIGDGFQLFGKIGYTHAAFVNVAPGHMSGARTGNRVPGVPEWLGAVGVTHRLSLDNLGLGGDLVSTAEFQFTGGRRPADIGNSFDLKNYKVFNARVGWENDNVSVYAFGRNIFNERVELAGTAFTPTIHAVTPGLGRTIGAGIEIKF